MAPQLTPMLEQYHRIKAEHRDAILMFRMGDFYEMFFEDAVKASEVLDIALTARGRGTDNEAPMCGVPQQAVDSYIARLIASGLRVAVCDQVEEAGKARGLVRREVIRVVSPGTLTDPACLDARDALYIACLLPDASGVGAAFVELSTGAFHVAQALGAAAWERIGLPLAAFPPREILAPEGADLSGRLPADLAAAATLTRMEPSAFTRHAATRAMTEQLGTVSLEGFGCQQMELAVRAGGALLQHLRITQKSALAHIQRVVPYHAEDHMTLDAATLRSLEVIRSLAGGGRSGSLLAVLDRSVTPMGARRLQAWLLTPHVRTAPIHQRLDAVGELAGQARQREALRGSLSGIRDLERLLGRVTLGTAGPRDLAAVRDSLAPLPGIRDLISGLSASLLTGRPGPLITPDTSRPEPALDALEDLHALLAAALLDEPAPTLSEGGIVREGCRAELDELRAISKDGRSYIAALEARERQRSGIASLKVRYNRVFGYYIEISKANLALAPADYERRQTLVGAERFVTPELRQYEEKVLTAQERSQALEREIFEELRDQVARRAARVAATAGRLADLDALASLAEVACARGYSRPVVTEEPRTRIVGGRHPVVEALSREERFVPNDLEVGDPSARVLIVTGPNMGGKSTYLRQTALITLMAQIGSFVPAAQAEIGVVDRIFSRIGSGDNLAGGQSTFMVEMQETANILNNSSARSLVLLDEVGRGTSTFDGLSLAWAIVEHLHDPPGGRGGPRVLFATHYHELTELALTLPAVSNLTVAVKESGQQVVFLRRIVQGAADRSYGIHVARLAGLPRRVVERAREVLANLERDELGRDGLPRLARHDPASGTGPAASGQMPLFVPPADPAELEVLEAIRSAEPDVMTPLAALQLLDRLRSKLTR